MDTVEILTLPVLPLPGGVMLPGMVATLTLDTDEARGAVAAARAGDGRLLLVPRVEGRDARMGLIAHVEQAGRLPGGPEAALLRGVSRAVVGAGQVDSSPSAEGVLRVEARPVPDGGGTARGDELGRELRAVLAVLAERRGSRRLPELLRNTSEAGALADGFAAWSEGPVRRAVDVLEALDVEARAEIALAWARDLLAEHEVTDKIRREVSDGIDKRQREMLLREQLAAIRKELGDDSESGGVDHYREQVAARDLPADVRDALERELSHLERTSEQSPEHGWIRSWIETLLDLPWGVNDDERSDVTGARAILDADHSGLDDVKARIVEHLAVRALRAERGLAAPRAGGVILALVGPPGVGKTSLGESVARATGRRFVRVALGGVHDEAEIRGHRRTYVGAMPGRIARALRDAATMNPVILLDEVDKLGADWRGDPSGALLEVLDPAQNHTFRDHYLDVDLDLSGVLFLATANVVDTIPGPLLDRMEVVRLDGYTEDEKVAIARGHLLDRQIERNGLRPDEVAITDAAIAAIVRGYTHEAGVRQLEREIGTLLRKVAARLVSERSKSPDATDATEAPLVSVDTADVPAYLGRPKVVAEERDERTAGPGVATGLAVTGAGGDVLFVEATTMDGEPGLTLTGQLGSVMKESAEIARSYVRSHAGDIGVDPADLARHVHLHVPAGAVPKDGPSAGVTMATALVSRLTGRPVRPEVGMTGELTLAGRVLPIGGVKQKVLAAQRAGLTTVILPARNAPDLDDVPAPVRDAMTFHLVHDVSEAFSFALTDVPAHVST